MILSKLKKWYVLGLSLMVTASFIYTTPSYASPPNLEGATLICESGEIKLETHIKSKLNENGNGNSNSNSNSNSNGNENGGLYSADTYHNGQLINREGLDPATVSQSGGPGIWSLWIPFPPDWMLSYHFDEAREISQSRLQVHFFSADEIMTDMACTLSLRP